MIDFSGCRQLNKGYGGANGKKISVVYDDEVYMLKFASRADKNENLSYSNSCFSEYIGCHVFESLGISAQKTLLGMWENKPVVACKDFTYPNLVIQDFASIKNQIVDSERDGYGTDLEVVLQTIEQQQVVDPAQLAEFFWDMFIVDAFIGNWDRHNGNWGFLYNQTEDSLTIAPIFDCGSALYPQLTEQEMISVIHSKQEINLRIFERPTSALELNGKRINYYRFLSECEYEDCLNAIERIVPKIDMEEIKSIIQNTPGITDAQTNFYTTMLTERKIRILDVAYNRIPKNDYKDDYEGYDVPEESGPRL